RCLWLGDVAQGRVKEHRIEASILVAESAAVTLLKRKISELPGQFSCPCDEDWRGVHTESLCDLGQARKKAGYCSGTTADFKHVSLFGEGDLRDKVVEYAPLEKVCCAKLQCRGQAIKSCRIGSGNLSIDVWHASSSP